MKTGKKIFLTVVAVLVALTGLTVLGTGADKSQFRSPWDWPAQWDPAVGMTWGSTGAHTALYDTLVYPDQRGNPLPHAAARWTVSEDGTEWTFFLRTDIKFHDGTTLTAEDVAFSMDRWLTIGEGFSYIFSPVIDRVEAVDDYTAKFHLSIPFGPLLTALYKFYIVNKDLVLENLVKPGPYGELGDYGREFLQDKDAGSGPYRITEYRPGDYMIMERADDYWGYVTPNAPDQVIQYGLMEAVPIRLMMEKREAEFTNPWLSPETMEALDAIEGVDLAAIPLGAVQHVEMHTKKPPLDDIHFRKAMAYATDYETIVQQAFPTGKVGAGPVPSSVPGYDPNVKPYYLDLDKALDELKQSKYYEDLDQYPVEFWWIGPGGTAQEKIALILQANMAKIGITLKPVEVPFARLQDVSSDMDASPHMYTLTMASLYHEAGSMLHFRYHSDGARSLDQNEWLLDSEYDRLLDDALATVDQAERFAKYSKLQQYIVDLCPTLFLAEPASTLAYQTEYLDWPITYGEGIPLVGYFMDPRWIQVFPELK